MDVAWQRGTKSRMIQREILSVGKDRMIMGWLKWIVDLQLLDKRITSTLDYPREEFIGRRNDQSLSARCKNAWVYLSPSTEIYVHVLWRRLYQGMPYMLEVRMAAYAGAARRLVMVLLRPPSCHRPSRRQARHAHILQIGLHLTQQRSAWSARRHGSAPGSRKDRIQLLVKAQLTPF